eukprot:TRINITY_DN108579_c0_g1_i1.p1 TRINITY_DN108579_c0_g1~~TRINITY_DN108579_c0_g1_i1.p1  ORF type:complete len:324 (-),score=58.40 TRINITY_DN108579_c0_g1_i1:16-987(-)
MAKVLCALKAFEALPDTLPTAGAVAAEFLGRFDPQLAEAGCAVEVYRLQRLSAEERLYAEDQLLCSIPSWHFDMDSLDQLHGELEDSKAALAELELRHERAAAALATLSAAGAPDAALAEATAAADAAAAQSSVCACAEGASAHLATSPSPLGSPGGTSRRNAAAPDGNTREVRMLLQQLVERDAQLAEEKQTQQKLRADLLALREQSQHLMQLVVSVDNGKRPALAQSQGPATLRSPGPVGDVGPGSRSRAGTCTTPQTVRSSPSNGRAVASTRPGTRPRSVQPRGCRGDSGNSVGHHSAGPPSLRHRRFGIVEGAAPLPAA